MNYRNWLLYRAQQYQRDGKPSEPEVLRYDSWQNYQARRDWLRRSGVAHMLAMTPAETVSESRIA